MKKSSDALHKEIDQCKEMIWAKDKALEVSCVWNDWFWVLYKGHCLCYVLVWLKKKGVHYTYIDLTL